MKLKKRFSYIKEAFSVGGKKSFSDRSIPLQPDSFIAWALGGTGRVTPMQAMEFYRKTSAVASAVDKIADAIEQIKPVLATKIGDEIVIDANHDIVKNIMNPNPYETHQEFIGKLARHHLLTRCGYFLMIGNKNLPPHWMFAPKPQNMSVLQGNDNFPESFLLSGNEVGAGNYVREVDLKKETVKYLDGNLREIYQIMGFSSRSDDMQADSPLEAAAQDVRQQIRGKTHNLSLLKNGGRLSLVFSFKDEHPNDDEHDERKQRINEAFAGDTNAGRIAVVTSKELDVKEFGTTNKDMDYANLDKTSSLCIWQRFKIPHPLVIADAATYNNVENAIFDLYEGTILPEFKTLYSGISKPLLPRYGLDPATSVLTYDPESIPVIIRQKMKELVDRKKINIETTNELRAGLPNREPVTGGDVIYQNATLVPIGTDLSADDDFETPEELAERIKRETEAENE